MQQDYLVIGHICLDRLPDGRLIPGGTALYGAVQATRLGLATDVLSAGNAEALAGPLRPYRDLFTVDLHDTPETTIFVNVGVGAARKQSVAGWAGVIPLAGRALDARIIHLGPIAREIDLNALPDFPTNAFVGATPQGWLRRWGADGRVTEHSLDLPAALTARLDALVLSETEAPKAEAAIAAVRAGGGLVAITRGASACLLLDAAGEREVATIERPIVDDTGAGDIFAVAFFAALAEGQTPEESAQFAHAAAGLSIGGLGASAIATRAEIDAALAAGSHPSQ
jgi:sugar/nucleoside kinase (ribokinase family)